MLKLISMHFFWCLFVKKCCAASHYIITYNDQLKEYEMGRGRNTNGEKRNAYGILLGKPEGKRPLG
jgi:hypothetical protein